MRARLDAILRKNRIGASIAGRLRFSYLVVMALMLIPVVVSLGMMTGYAARYHAAIEQVERVVSLKPVVTEIPEELWSVVAGRKTFAEGTQYETLSYVFGELDDLRSSAAEENPKELIVARRTTDTLKSYIDRMGEQMQTGSKVAQNEELLEETRSVANLIADMLEEYSAVEIRYASDMNRLLQGRLTAIISLVLLLLIFTLAFALIAQKSLSRAIHEPIHDMESFAGALASGNLNARAPGTEVAELKGLNSSLNIMAGKLQELLDENRREQENLKKSELRTLQAQINPHFLYNTLDAIVWLAEARRMGEVISITRALSDFFRISLSQGRDWIPLSEEVKHLQGYLTIQKVRYRDILDYRIDIPDQIRDRQILKLLLQPLVENAIYHGIKHRRGKGLLIIEGRETDGRLIMRVMDNGAGMTEERLKQVRESLAGEGGMSAEGDAPSEVGYGLRNVDLRIKLYYGQPLGIRVDSGENGTTVSFDVPARSFEENV